MGVRMGLTGRLACSPPVSLGNPRRHGPRARPSLTSHLPPYLSLPPPSCLSDPKAELILKAQIHAGGRGKGTFDNGFKGGVKICTTAEQVEQYAAQMLGAKLVTKQTGPAGQLCAKVLVNEGISIGESSVVFEIRDGARAQGWPDWRHPGSTQYTRSVPYRRPRTHPPFTFLYHPPFQAGSCTLRS